MKYKLYTDGGARGNPGPAGIGGLIFDENDRLVWLESIYIKNTTNNFAEYMAIYTMIKSLFKKKDIKKDDEIVCHLDSELVVKQLNGEYKVKNAELKEIHEKIKNLVNGYNFHFVHVYRENNIFADKLVNISLDAADESSKS